jgi:hypothetical protein
MIRAAVLALVVSGAGPVLAQVQPPQDRINTAIARARQVGVPVALLESKIAEGKAKGVSLERIATAIEKREAALERASQAMTGQQGIRGDDLSMAADALESGVSEAVLRTIAETAPRDRRAVAIAALTQLVELGHVPEAALDRVREALKRGPDALANLPAQAGKAAGRGNGPPETSGSAGRRGGGSGGPPASVPAPGGTSQPTKPGGKPETPGGPPTNPAGRGNGPGAGRGGA